MSLSSSGVRSGYASHALHDQIFRDCDASRITLVIYRKKKKSEKTLRK